MTTLSILPPEINHVLEMLQGTAESRHNLPVTQSVVEPDDMQNWVADYMLGGKVPPFEEFSRVMLAELIASDTLSPEKELLARVHSSYAGLLISLVPIPRHAVLTFAMGSNLKFEVDLPIPEKASDWIMPLLRLTWFIYLGNANLPGNILLQLVLQSREAVLPVQLSVIDTLELVADMLDFDLIGYLKGHEANDEDPQEGQL